MIDILIHNLKDFSINENLTHFILFLTQIFLLQKRYLKTVFLISLTIIFALIFYQEQTSENLFRDVNSKRYYSWQQIQKQFRYLSRELLNTNQTELYIDHQKKMEVLQNGKQRTLYDKFNMKDTQDLFQQSEFQEVYYNLLKLRVFELIKILITWLGLYAVYLQTEKSFGYFTNAIKVGFSYIFYLIFCLYSVENNSRSVLDFFLTKQTLHQQIETMKSIFPYMIIIGQVWFKYKRIKKQKRIYSLLQEKEQSGQQIEQEAKNLLQEIQNFYK